MESNSVCNHVIKKRGRPIYLTHSLLEFFPKNVF